MRLRPWDLFQHTYLPAVFTDGQQRQIALRDLLAMHHRAAVKVFDLKLCRVADLQCRALRRIEDGLKLVAAVDDARPQVRSPLVFDAFLKLVLRDTGETPA